MWWITAVGDETPTVRNRLIEILVMERTDVVRLHRADRDDTRH
jgi:hypothetical protein